MRLVIHAWRDLANPAAGGSERHIDQLARAMVDRGHEVVLVAGGPVGPRPYQVVCAGGAYAQYATVPLVHRRLAEPDVVVDVANGMTYWSPLWSSAPVVLMCHHVHLDQWATRFPRPVAWVGRLLEGQAMPRTYRRNLVVACSPSTADSLGALGYDPELIRVVVPSVAVPAVDATAPERAPQPEFVTVGRLMPYKRVDLLLQMWRSVHDRIGGTLHVVGDGPERASLEAMATPGVVFHGHVDEQEKLRLLARSWLLVHGAMHEGWGIVISEAASVGTPTLAFDVPGVRDATRHDVSGVLVHDRHAFENAWVELAADPDRRRRLGSAARDEVARSGASATGDAFEAVCVEATRRHLVRRR